MKKFLVNARDGLLTGRYNLTILAFAFAFVALVFPDAAFAQRTSSNPFDIATGATDDIMSSLQTFALAVGGIGMISCLLLGFFGKLNWKWVATGIGVSFAIAIVPSTITWLGSLGRS